MPPHAMHAVCLPTAWARAVTARAGFWHAVSRLTRLLLLPQTDWVRQPVCSRSRSRCQITDKITALVALPDSIADVQQGIEAGFNTLQDSLAQVGGQGKWVPGPNAGGWR